MDAAAILAIVAKGLALLPSLIQAGVDVYDYIERLRKAAAGNLTDAELTDLETELDARLADFNADM